MNEHALWPERLGCWPYFRAEEIIATRSFGDDMARVAIIYQDGADPECAWQVVAMHRSGEPADEPAASVLYAGAFDGAHIEYQSNIRALEELARDHARRVSALAKRQHDD